MAGVGGGVGEDGEEEGRPAEGPGPSGIATAHEYGGTRFSRLGDQTQDQRRDAKRSGTTVPRYVYESEVDVSEVGSSVLELFERSVEEGKRDPPVIGAARAKVGQFRNDIESRSIESNAKRRTPTVNAPGPFHPARVFEKLRIFRIFFLTAGEACFTLPTHISRIVKLNCALALLVFLLESISFTAARKRT